ncbi:copper chaperone PCu(A)C [Veronia pacifica]|uniref:Transporter n=1 Tax=Veronia pacifica TaxID=1080227 RepID=A0A1C3EQR4_9GAMM|nr:copper chaperone PCu(A)C [Veronia pacifica]ODA35580.1 transporter [Veronia pacifica]
MKKTSLCLALMLSCFHPLAIACSDHHSETQEPLNYSEVQNVSDVLTIEGARAKATIPGVKVSSGYMKIINKSDKAIRLTSATTSVADHTEFHRMFMRDSRMAMRKLDALEVPANGSIELNHQGYHLMFMGVQNAFEPGQVIKVTMTEDNGQTHDVLLTVTPIKKH